MTWVAQSGKRAQGQLLREKVPGVATTLANKTWVTEHWMQREGRECRAKKNMDIRKFKPFVLVMWCETVLIGNTVSQQTPQG